MDISKWGFVVGGGGGGGGSVRSIGSDNGHASKEETGYYANNWRPWAPFANINNLNPLMDKQSHAMSIVGWNNKPLKFVIG